MSKLYSSTTYTRPEFMDCSIDLDLFEQPNWVVELKQDGIWGTGICVDGQMTIYSLGNEPKGIIDLGVHITAVFAGEYMFGSNWAQRHGEVGHFHVFDIFAFERNDFRDRPLSYRRSFLEMLFKQYIHTPQVTLNQMYPVSQRHELWEKFVDAQDYEGLVFKNLDEPFNNVEWYRVKKTFTVDYVCMGFNEGNGRNKGRVGAMVGGLYVNGILMQTCLVGSGFSDEMRQALWDNQSFWIGKTFEASGYKVFPSGALRHPTFIRWRPDKEPTNCTIENLHKSQSLIIK